MMDTLPGAGDGRIYLPIGVDRFRCFASATGTVRSYARARDRSKRGDMIVLDTEARLLSLDIPAEELERRRAAFVAPPPAFERGYGRLYIDHVQQADRGVDFDFLVGKSGAFVPRDTH